MSIKIDAHIKFIKTHSMYSLNSTTYFKTNKWISKAMMFGNSSLTINSMWSRKHTSKLVCYKYQ